MVQRRSGAHTAVFPFSSDDGFSVMDYLAVNESHGGWPEIEAIARDYKLMSDLVINHMSARSRWFENYKKRIDPGKDYFFEGNPKDDLSQVVRPRTSPLLINTLVTGNCRHLKTWLMSMPPAQLGTTYLNFIASHDGVGLRPTDGLLTEDEKQRLINTMESFGGKVSYRWTADGRDQPYEMNIALWDALKGTAKGGADHWQLVLSDINLIGTDRWVDLISGMEVDDLAGSITLKPYQSVWLSNQQRSGS